jgi:hypothetical protein
MQSLFVRLALAGASLRAVPRILTILADALGWLTDIPHWTTGRLWLLRVGHAMLTRDKEPGDDWAWLIDHSVQIGQEKCLVILGLRLRDLPRRGQCLTHQDLQEIALVPRKSWTRQEVDEALEAAIEKTGVPRVIVNDHGGDVHGGVSFFRKRHRQTVEIYDAKHKAACVLKRLLEKNPRWQEFQRRVGQARCAIQQTELAFLVPPAPKLKARFMNLASTLQWASKALVVLQHPPAPVQKWVRPERLQEKLGWLQEFTTDLAEWSEWQAIVDAMVTFVNRHGLYRGAAQDLRAALPRYPVHVSSRHLVRELRGFVATQARRACPGERFPGSTEVLESCFGRYKQLEKQQARGGFTSLLLGFGAFMAKTTTTAIKDAMSRSRTRDIVAWCKQHLGTTLLSQRKLAFAESATQIGRNAA